MGILGNIRKADVLEPTVKSAVEVQVSFTEETVHDRRGTAGEGSLAGVRMLGRSCHFA